MASAGDGVTTVEIEILIAVARVDPDALAAFCGDRHFLVSRELELILDRDGTNLWTGSGHQDYGFVPANIKPVFSSNPNIKFIFCTA